jgi:hypothetical protein
MNRWTRTKVLVTLGLAAGLAGATTTAMTVKEIMGKLNKGPYALTPNLKRGLQKDDPDWGEIQDEAKQYVNLVSDLGKAQPPKGDQASWEKLTKEYAAIAKTLEQAVQKKDKTSALAAHGKMSQVCTVCHKAHRND